MVGKEEEVAFLTREGSEKMNLPYTASFEGKDNVNSIGLVLQSEQEVTRGSAPVDPSQL